MARGAAMALPTVALALSVALGVLGYRAAARCSSAQAKAMPVGSRPRAPDHAVLRVPHLSASIVLDGDTDDPGWRAPPGPARTGPFLLSNGAAARPYSDARIVWGDGHLYLVLYAADEDIRSSAMDGAGADSFRLRFRRGGAVELIDVSPTGELRSVPGASGADPHPTWMGGAHVSHEIDGTVDDPTDSDEEWVIEMAIPLASLGAEGRPGERIAFAVSRCDAPKRGPRVCAGWGGDALGEARWEAGERTSDAAEALGEIVLE
jgi:hypothetical protein